MVSIWAALWRPHAPQRPRSADPGTRRVRPAAGAPRPDFVAFRLGAASRAQARAQRAERPGIRKPALRKKAVGAGVAEEEERWQRTGMGTAHGPVQNFRPWPASHVPAAKPLPLSQVSYRMAWPRGHLDATFGSWVPAPTVPPQPGGPRAGSTCSPPAMTPLPHCWNGRSFWPSVFHLDICLAAASSIL